MKDIEKLKGSEAVIIKETAKTNPAGILETQKLLVEGQCLDEVRKHFDELWEKDE